MRHLIAGAIGGLFLMVAARAAVHGDTFAAALVFGAVTPILAIIAAVLLPAKKPHVRQISKPDPEYIAALERDLGIGPAQPLQPRETVSDYAQRMAEWGGNVNVVDTEAPTTVAKPPEQRSVGDCPRPEGCVISHPCRKCGAPKMHACIDDPYIDTQVRQAKEQATATTEKVDALQERLDEMARMEAKVLADVEHRRMAQRQRDAAMAGMIVFGVLVTSTIALVTVVVAGAV